MKFEVTDRREEKEGLIFKKSVYKAKASIHLETNEFETLKTMASSKQWGMYELGRIQLSEKISQDFTVGGFYNWAKKTGRFERTIRTYMPEERELQIQEMQELAQKAKTVIGARLSALEASDDDVSIEI